MTALVPAELGRLYPVGRLDRESTGLVILTNDGDLAERLTHPRYGVEKEYRVVVAPPVEPGDLARLRSGVFDEGERLRAAGARLTGPAAGGKSELSLILKEGRKREIRRLFAQLGRRVIELERVRIGTVRLGRLPAGRWRSLTPAELAGLGAGRE
ncbi:MAG: Ribosomal small subunit pseudouridine synthase A [candidate division TA06 bacterium ADurb.Bin417]|uniref:Pseudouridine synthase n=1 Tax=candidate division TA06 bacterium ADurb.Bin417 TaxID=1852828 RepID=A0A1V5MCS9_UNCT6|nr:MAG: Ribosomal small subunit pseudouridine synthase A [candidate division TA06 bacterium ADurb.Bin417]